MKVILDQLTNDYSEETHIRGVSYENDFMTISPDGVITAKAGYSWNYCSPQFRLFGIRVGAWNGNINPKTGKVQTYAASLIHDVLYDDTRHGISRLECDKIFLQLAKRDGFLLSDFYFFLIRVFGDLFWTRLETDKD